MKGLGRGQGVLLSCRAVSQQTFTTADAAALPRCPITVPERLNKTSQRPVPVQQAGNMTTIILQEMNQINVQMRLSGHSSVESAVVFSRDEKFQPTFLDVPGCLLSLSSVRTIYWTLSLAGQAKGLSNPFMNHKGSLFSRMDSQIGDFCQITCQATCSQSRSSEDAPVQSSVQ